MAGNTSLGCRELAVLFLLDELLAIELLVRCGAGLESRCLPSLRNLLRLCKM